MGHLQRQISDIDVKALLRIAIAEASQNQHLRPQIRRGHQLAQGCKKQIESLADLHPPEEGHAPRQHGILHRRGERFALRLQHVGQHQLPARQRPMHAVPLDQIGAG